jgi:hypothetical protein
LIDVNSIKVYYLNPDSFVARKKSMDEYLEKLGFKFERAPSNSSYELRQNRICEGFIKLTERAIANGEYPFLILEDDARLIDSLPEKITIPDEATLIYWGASTWECGGIKPKLAINCHNSEYYRLHHSLGCHAILIPDRLGADHFIKINQMAINASEYSDILFAVESANSVYLTPTEGPYFYQNDAHTEPITRFKWKDLIANGIVST